MRRAVRDGRISLIEGRIDPVAADAQWQRNTRVRLGSRASADVPASSSAESNRAGNDPDADGYWSVKVRRERAEAEMAELKLAEQRGELVRAVDMRSNLARRYASLREALLQLPARVVPILAAQPEPALMDQVLRAEIVTALAQLVEAA